MENEHKSENKHELRDGLAKIVAKYSLDSIGGFENNDSDSSFSSNAED